MDKVVKQNAKYANKISKMRHLNINKRTPIYVVHPFRGLRPPNCYIMYYSFKSQVTIHNNFVAIFSFELHKNPLRE